MFTDVGFRVRVRNRASVTVRDRFGFEFSGVSVNINSTQLNRPRDLDGKRDQKGKKSKSL